MLRTSPSTTLALKFGSHAQPKKLDSYLSVMIFGNFMHPAVVIKNPNFSFSDHVRNICKTCYT